MKLVFRKECGNVVSRRVSDREADALTAKGWLLENPEEAKPKKRGRPRKAKVEEPINDAEKTDDH